MKTEMLKPKVILAAGVLLLLLTAEVQAQTSHPVTPRLSGIVNLGDANKSAILETPPAGPFGRQSYFLLREGQSEGQIAVVEILPKTGSIRLNTHSNGGESTLTLTNHTGETPANIVGLRLENVSLEPFLTLYSQLSKRTLLRSPRLPDLTFALVGSATNEAAAVLELNQALREKGVAAIPDGEKFMMIVPLLETASVQPRSSEVTPSGTIQSALIPAGLVNFPGTDIGQVLQIYAELVGRKWDRSVPNSPARNRTIRFKNQTPLSRAEVVYALDTMLEWAGLKMVQVGEDQVKLVPTVETNR